MKRKLCQNLQFVIRSELKKHSLFPYLWSSKDKHLKTYFRLNVNPNKESGWMEFSSGWQGCSSGFPSGFALGKSLGAALPALGKPPPSLLFYSD